MKVSWTTSELKETILVLLGLSWGLILLLPGNSFFPPNRIDYLGLYAEDWVWGGLLTAVSVPMLLLPRYRYPGYRKAAHAFYWVFWLGIVFLALLRSMGNGLQPVDLLIVLPFLTLALLHGVIYIGLGRRP